jgi:pimeloyl-ACP methyl ester carboxylesterase
MPAERPVPYDEFGLFHENAAELGLPYDGPPAVRRDLVEVEPGRRLSALVWGEGDPELVLLHGGSQNAHTWDTVALALRPRPLVAIDLPGHGHSDGPGPRQRAARSPRAAADDVAVAVRSPAPRAAGVVGTSYGGMTTIALAAAAPELVRRVVLVDVLPGLDPEHARHIRDFVDEERRRRHLPTAEVVRFDGAGHSIQGDMPLELAATIARFIP